MKKILWLSNFKFSDVNPTSSVTWIYSLCNALVETGESQILNITDRNKISKIAKSDSKKIKQWLISQSKLKKDGLPQKNIINFIINIEAVYKPDLVHIRETVNYWGMLAASKYIKLPVLLEMQGLMFTCAKKNIKDLGYPRFFDVSV